jgi:ribosomal protein S18 acetylase RimI-like enzyme
MRTSAAGEGPGRLDARLVPQGERAALAPLVGELLRHYDLPAPDDAEIGRILTEQPTGVEMLVAFAGPGPVGLASFAQIFPGEGAAPQLYMKELYVAEACRGGGVGEALMRALARVAMARGCTRIDWTTARDNLGAQAFYRRIGARPVDEKVYFRLDAEGIGHLAREAPGSASLAPA